jgi:hypothetical protein
MVDESTGNATRSEHKSPIGDLTNRLNGIFKPRQNNDEVDFMSPEERLLSDIASTCNYRPDQVIALAAVYKENPDKIGRLYLTERGLRESDDPKKSSAYEELKGLATKVFPLRKCIESDPWISVLASDYRAKEPKNRPMHFNVRLSGDRFLVLYLDK